MTSRKSNIKFLIFLFGLTILMWFKLIIDFVNYHRQIKPLLITLISVGLLTYLIFGISVCLSALKSIDKKVAIPPSGWMWLFIPLSVICTSPVCYRHTIFIAPYLPSTIIRLTLLFAPFLLFATKSTTSDKGIFVLNILALLSMFPNDKCNNMFNYSWIHWLGASPLTYFPTIITIIFYSLYTHGSLTKIRTTLTLSVICIGALTIALGHRIHLLW
jgi:hypothetical protein